MDKYYKMLEKSYTFNNGKVGPHLLVSTHIDKFMVLVELDAKGGKIETKTLVKWLSYHSPLILSIWL